MGAAGSVSLVYTLSEPTRGDRPTRQEMETKGAAIGHYEDGESPEYRIVFGDFGMLKQLGVIAE